MVKKSMSLLRGQAYYIQEITSEVVMPRKKKLKVEVEMGEGTAALVTRELLKLYDENKHILIKHEDKSKAI